MTNEPSKDTDSPRAPRRVGIVVVHGVIPHPRYEIQDQAAAALADALNERAPGKSGAKWVTDVLNPPTAPGTPPSPPKAYESRTTITRVRQLGPQGYIRSDVYDVVEAYWSPLDKNKTNWRSVLSWLLTTIFVPANTTARYMASWQKTGFDIGYVLIAALLALAALVFALWAALNTFQQIASISGTGSSTSGPGLTALWAILGDPTKAGQFLSFQAIALLACAVVGGFTLVQAIRATISVIRQMDALSKIAVQLWSRAVFIAILVAISALLLGLAALLPLPAGKPMGWWALGFAVAALAFELGRAILESFIANFFGDVQIYTTHDENSDFYALRKEMLDVVSQTIGDMTSATAADGANPYDRVHVLAHSLGSTIAMDALIRLYNLKEQHLYASADFDRLRSFVTFGSPLEKTKYFFDIANPSQSLSYVQWRNDAYGVLFSDQRASLGALNGLGEGIFWMNFWYFKDPVANKIDSYRSFLVPGDALGDAAAIRAAVKQKTASAGDSAIGRPICANERHPGIIDLFQGRFIPHGDYLGDKWFWSGPAGFGTFDVVTSSATTVPTKTHFASIAAANVTAPHPARYEMLAPKDARWHRDRYE